MRVVADDRFRAARTNGPQPESCKESAKYFRGDTEIINVDIMSPSLRLLTIVIAVALPGSALTAQQIPGRIHDLDSLAWRPAGPRAEIAVVDGDPQSDGNYAIALRFAAGGMIPPHFHPKETRVVVVRGQAQIGFGDEADTARARVLGPGGYAVIPAQEHHFEAGKTDAIIIVYGVGPLKTTMVKAGPPHP